MTRKYSRRTVLARTAQLGAVAAFMNSPLSAARALAQAEAEVGRHLIGDLEGPEVVTERSLWPTSFSEAPELAARVANGELPPVAERIGRDPLVIKPVHEIGQYGGTWRRGFTGPGDGWSAYRTVAGPDNLLFFDYQVQEVVPWIAKGWTINDGGREVVIHLREGMRWSDGEPFTADDFVFWFEHMYNHPEIVRSPSPYMEPGEASGVLEKIDQHNFLFRFDVPYHILAEALAGPTDLDGQARLGLRGMGLFAPAHYLQQFHPEFVEEAQLTADAAQEGYDNWVLRYLSKNNWLVNPDLPSVTPWKLRSPISNPSWEWERNPYSIWVDTDGNQLPYIDQVVFSLAENLELLNLRAIAGDYDWQERHVDIGNLPILVGNQEAQNYRIFLDPNGAGSDLCLIPNHSFDGDPEIASWLQNVDFRRALSMGIDRDEMNEIFWLGLGQPRTIVPSDDNRFNPGPEYARLWAEHDVEAANRLLDEIGLTERDAEGYRLRTDGGGRLTFELSAYAGQSLPFGQMCEVVRNHWRDIGIDATVNEMERSLGESRARNNELQIFAFGNDGSDHLFIFPNVLPLLNPAFMGQLWGEWYRTNGERGVEPAPFMREALEKFRAAFSATDEERVQLGKDIWALLVDNVSMIGVVGLSPAHSGVRVVSNRMGNVPSLQSNTPVIKTSAGSGTMTVFFRE